MTFTRLVLILTTGLLVTDYQFGTGRMLQSISDRTVELGHELDERLSISCPPVSHLEDACWCPGPLRPATTSLHSRTGADRTHSAVNDIALTMKERRQTAR